MANSPSSEASHDSGDEGNDNGASSKTPALKDKECQYCHQKFTSSSLGRHLDQFISKKKPDGVHDVDEIRRLRGGITRRTARNTKKEQDDGHSTQHSPSPQYTLPSYSELVTKTANAPTEMRFNRMNWQATGVITDPTHINPPTAGAPTTSMPNPPANSTNGTKRNFSTYAADLPAFNPVTSETTRALELSLREVLDAVRTATKRASAPAQPFPFDFTAQTFPYLCLALLPVPATLFTSSPFATSASVPLSPPALDQYQALQKTVQYRVDEWKWARLAYIQRTSASSDFSEDVDSVNDMASTQGQTALNHLESAYQNFMSFPPDSRHSLWIIELLRSFKLEQEKVKECNLRIERMTHELDQLQQQIDHLSRCQWPREMALWPPDRVVLDDKTRQELSRVNLVGGEANDAANGNREGSPDEEHRGGIDRWDYELLVNKWKKHVREDRSRRTGIQPSMPFMPTSGPPFPPENRAPAPSEHSATSTPRIPSGPPKTSGVDYRGNNTGQHTETSSIHNSPTVNGGGNGAPSGPTGFDSRRRNIQVISDVDDIFSPRLRGLRADGMVKSATP